MNPILCLLVLVLGITAQGAVLAVPTVSSPIPQAVLAVQHTLDSETRQLGEAFSVNADTLEQVAIQLDGCNAEIPAGQQPTPNQSSRYLECRQDAVGKAQDVYAALSQALKDFADGIGTVRKQIAGAIASNTGHIQRYEREQRKLDQIYKKSLARAKKLAQDLPDSDEPTREQLQEMRRLASEIQYTKANQALVEQVLASLEGNQRKLNKLSDALSNWRDEADATAYDFSLKADLLGKTIAAGAAVAEAQVLIAQFDGIDTKRLRKLWGRISNFDYNSYLGKGPLPVAKGSDAAGSTALLGGGDRELIEFFRSLRDE